MWIDFQMPSKMNWSNIGNDHVKPISMFDVLSKDEELKKVFNWINTKPSLKNNHQRKGNNFHFLRIIITPHRSLSFPQYK